MNWQSCVSAMTGLFTAHLLLLSLFTVFYAGHSSSEEQKNLDMLGQVLESMVASEQRQVLRLEFCAHS